MARLEDAHTYRNVLAYAVLGLDGNDLRPGAYSMLRFYRGKFRKDKVTAAEIEARAGAVMELGLELIMLAKRFGTFRDRSVDKPLTNGPDVNDPDATS